MGLKKQVLVNLEVLIKNILRVLNINGNALQVKKHDWLPLMESRLSHCGASELKSLNAFASIRSASMDDKYCGHAQFTRYGRQWDATTATCASGLATSRHVYGTKRKVQISWRYLERHESRCYLFVMCNNM